MISSQNPQPARAFPDAKARAALRNAQSRKPEDKWPSWGKWLVVIGAGVLGWAAIAVAVYVVWRVL